jgi:hypothetical protein
MASIHRRILTSAELNQRMQLNGRIRTSYSRQTSKGSILIPIEKDSQEQRNFNEAESSKGDAVLIGALPSPARIWRQ